MISPLTLFTSVTRSQLEGAGINEAKKVLADEATALLHGRDCLPEIWDTASSLFKKEGGDDTSGLERVELPQSELGSTKVVDMFLALGLASSKKDARRLIQGGGAKIRGDKIDDDQKVLVEEDFVDGECVLRAGKKRAGVVVLS